MNGRAVGERAGWLLAAAVLAVGGTIGFNARPAARGAPADPVAVVEAATDRGAPDPGAPGSPSASFRATRGANSGFGAEMADAFGWPSTQPLAPTTPPSPPAAAPTPPKPAPVWWSRYVGTNHVWMPTLGVNRPVYSFPCSRGAAPDNVVYRWGCAGRNNVYLLGHAWGVFEALHDAYSNGRLRVGMPVIYADSQGQVRLYRVVTWRVVHPVDASWAMASQRVPSMTLQTCIGPNGSLRLNVRLVAADS